MMLDLKNFSRSLLEDKGYSVSQSDNFGHAYLWIGTRGGGGGGGGGGICCWVRQRFVY